MDKTYDLKEDKTQKKIKVDSIDIVVTGTKEKPYYAIKYREVGNNDDCVGYGSYSLENVLGWKEERFELAEHEPDKDFVDAISSITETIRTKFEETETKFIYQTVLPFCSNTVNRVISKKELDEMLVRAERMKWIPCNERMPKGTVLCCDDRGNMLVGLLCEDEAGYMAYDDDGQEMYNCVAWMPLPEPYRGE